MTLESTISGQLTDRHSHERFVQRFGGNVTLPSDPEYDDARAVWNGMIDRYPALIAHCESTAQVVQALEYAREQQLPIAVRGGGHNVAGHGTCDGGIVIDLAKMNAVTVDPEARIARVDGGALWADVDTATQKHGLATPGGVFSRTGVAGLTLGGGFGWLASQYGLSCDNLIGAEVITADGRIIVASEDENPELLWGLRGGGGNFGIVTRFVFQLHPVGPEVYFVFVLHDAEGDKLFERLCFFRDWCESDGDNIGAIASFGVVPPDPHVFPEEIHLKPFVLFGALYSGPAEEGMRVLQPLREIDEPLVDFSDTMQYVDVQQIFDPDYPDGMRYYWKSLNIGELTDAALLRMIEHSRRQPGPFSTTDIWPVGPGIKRGSLDDSAFFGREAAYLLNVEANWEDPGDDEAHIQWVRSLIDEMGEFSDGSRYLNFAGFQEEGDAMMAASYGPQYRRLQALKAQYDPDNIFRLNQNVPPRS